MREIGGDGGSGRAPSAPSVAAVSTATATASFGLSGKSQDVAGLVAFINTKS